MAAHDHPELGPNPLMGRISKAFTSERLVYRGVEKSDADFLTRVKSDPVSNMNDNPGFAQPYVSGSTDGLMGMIEKNLIAAIVELPGADGGERTPIGLVCLWDFYGVPNPSRAAKLGIDILAPYQGKGYGTEALRWVLDWAFEMGGLHRVGLQVFSWNTSAIRMYEKVGFERAGVEKEAIWCAGRWWDLITYGLIDRDWHRIQERTTTVRSSAGR